MSCCQLGDTVSTPSSSGIIAATAVPGGRGQQLDPRLRGGRAQRTQGRGEQDDVADVVRADDEDAPGRGQVDGSAAVGAGMPERAHDPVRGGRPARSAGRTRRGRIGQGHDGSVDWQTTISRSSQPLPRVSANTHGLGDVRRGR